jgi:hypothetical protein
MNFVRNIDAQHIVIFHIQAVELQLQTGSQVVILINQTFNFLKDSFSLIFVVLLDRPLKQK